MGAPVVGVGVFPAEAVAAVPFDPEVDALEPGCDAVGEQFDDTNFFL